MRSGASSRLIGSDRTPAIDFFVVSTVKGKSLTANFSRAFDMRIFVLADTHDKLPPKVIELARGADEIWHLGDVCAEIILDELRTIGPPVSVVRGNCDGNYEWPLTIDHKRGGLVFRLQHIPPER